MPPPEVKLGRWKHSAWGWIKHSCPPHTVSHLNPSGEWDAHAGPCAGHSSLQWQEGRPWAPGACASISRLGALKVLFICSLFSPQAYFVMGPLIGMCAGLIPLREISLFPALRTYLGGVKVISLIWLIFDSFLKVWSLLGRLTKEQLAKVFLPSVFLGFFSHKRSLSKLSVIHVSSLWFSNCLLQFLCAWMFH